MDKKLKELENPSLYANINRVNISKIRKFAIPEVLVRVCKQCNTEKDIKNFDIIKGHPRAICKTCCSENRHNKKFFNYNDMINERKEKINNGNI
jgi:hypothetical protein